MKNPESGIASEAGDSAGEGREQYLTHGEAQNGKAQIRAVVAAVPDEQIALLGESLQEQGVQQSKTAPLSGKSFAAQSLQEAILEKPSIQDALIREQPQIVPERGDLSGSRLRVQCRISLELARMRHRGLDTGQRGAKGEGRTGRRGQSVIQCSDGSVSGSYCSACAYGAS